MKPLKLKCILLTEDGEKWLCIRQFYATDLITNEFLDVQFQGMKLQISDKQEISTWQPTLSRKP
jgi:hypothetical protein